MSGEVLVSVRARRVEAPFKNMLAWVRGYRPSAGFIMDGNRIAGVHVEGMARLGGGSYRSWAARGDWILIFDGGPVFFCEDDVARRLIGGAAHDSGST